MKIISRSSLKLTPMNLADLLVRYLASRNCSRGYQYNLRRTVRKAEDSGIKTVCQLTPDAVNRLIAGLRKVGNTTRANIRRELLSLWKYAHDCSLTDSYPTRVVKVREDRRPVRTWAVEDLRKILVAAEKDQMVVSQRCPVPRAHVLAAWILIGYDGGMRFDDIHQLTMQDFRNGGESIAISARKTGKPLVRRMTEDTQLAVSRMFSYSPDGTLFQWCLPRRRAFVMWREFLDSNGFPGSSKWLRRTCATAIEMVAPGTASFYLQHSDAATTSKHYVDQSQFAIPAGPPPLRPR
jgi:integrase